MSFRKGRRNFPIHLLMYSHHTSIQCLSCGAVLFPSLYTFWRSHTLPSTKYWGHLRDVCFVGWTLSGHKGKHSMTETSKEEAKAEDNPFPFYGCRRERNAWELSNTTGFQQNILFQQKDLINWNGNVLQRSIFLSDLRVELRQDATGIHLLLCRLSWRAHHICHVNHKNYRHCSFWTLWPTNSWAVVPFCTTCPHHPLGKMEVHICSQVMTVLSLHNLRACKGWPQTCPTSSFCSHLFPLKLD